MRIVYDTQTGKVYTVKADDSMLTVTSAPVDEIYYDRYLTRKELVTAYVNLETLELYFKDLETPA